MRRDCGGVCPEQDDPSAAAKRCHGRWCGEEREGMSGAAEFPH
jgi:hypothetical protein